jgi:hypothetical protein
MGSGRIRLVVIGVVVAGGIGLLVQAVIGVINDEKPFTLQSTLPKMIADFGRDAGVVQIDVNRENDDDQYVDYLVLGTDGMVHRRDYVLSKHLNPGQDTPGYSRYIHTGVRPATAADRAGADVSLGQIPPGVVDELFKRATFPDSDSEATLAGGQWTLSSKALGKYGAQFVARYDGTEFRQTVSNPLDRLRCIQRADQDVTKILACEQRFMR